MEVSGEVKQEIAELALLYKECLETAKATIKCDILGPDESFHFKPEDYRQIATSIFIEHNIQRSKQRGQGNQQAKTETELSTNKQQNFIAGLATKGGKKAENIISQFLDNNEVDLIDQLSKTQATDLITMLKEEQ